MSKLSSAAPVNQIVGRIRAFICHETYLDVRGFCFARSSGKARMICARAAWDVDLPARLATIKVKRCPDLDSSMPKGYVNGFLSLPSVLLDSDNTNQGKP